MTSPLIVDPSEIGHGRVHFRVNALVGDSNDVGDLPDEIGVSGTWTMIPETSRILVGGDDPYTIVPLRVNGVFRNGDLEYRSQRGVWLLSPPRKSDGISPTFLWRFECDVRYGGMAIKQVIKFDLPPGDPEDEDYEGVDLTRVLGGA